jgi:predicted DsbA family dithiol-disulfide isomerase
MRVPITFDYFRCRLSVRLRYYTDPADPGSWAVEPRRRSLMQEFGDDLQITYVMGGLAREYGAESSARVREWLDAADRSGMPVDPRLWDEGGLRSSFPACMAVKAASEQGPQAAGIYLRALREGIGCRRRRLDSAEALVEEAREAGLDARRFRIDLESAAIVEAFAADLEESRSRPDGAPDGLPALRFSGDQGDEWRGADGDWRAAALAVGGHPAGGPRPDALEALRAHGRLATPEVAAVCDLPGPRAAAELWRLAAEWRVRPTRYLTGELWELA